MNIIKRIFGSDKIIDAGISAVDKIFYTDEEKADSHKAFLKLYEPFKLAQRLIALTVVAPYMAAWVVVFIASFFIDSDGLKLPLELLSGDIGTAVLLIIGFYFAGGTLASIKKNG